MAGIGLIDKVLVLCSSAIVAGCVAASTSPYFVRLDPVGEKIVKEKYGIGIFYFHYSRHRFSSYKNSREENLYLDGVEEEVRQKDICLGSFTVIRDSISYYSEGGEVSVLVKCDI
ncbi:hypothetical protein [Microbulbifer sp. PSTR4-B]|uniref:hypothetical protein n=1 Tax=Microbulbifer sp. PSTR4-B TaxID=3243396 RepID=UPI0040395598